MPVSTKTSVVSVSISSLAPRRTAAARSARSGAALLAHNRVVGPQRAQGRDDIALGLVVGLRRALPYVQRVSGVIMALMGLYLLWYGIYEIRLLHRGESGGRGPVGLVTGWSADVSDRLTRIDPLQAGLVLALVACSVVLVALLRTGRRDSR